MKQYLLIPLLFLSLAVFGQGSQQRNFPHQSKNDRQAENCPRVYIGVSTGINNNNGLLGVNADVSLSDAFSVGAGAGLSSWGYKVYGEGRYYFSPCNRGWALGAAVTYCTGGDEVTLNAETRYFGNQDVVLKLEPKTNVALSGYRFWTLGHRNNRMFLQLGWSLPLTETDYTVKNGYELTETSDQAVRITAPGGLIIGFGFSFALHG